MQISNILATKGSTVVTITPDHTIRDAVKLLAEKRIGAVVVVDAAGRPVGIVSERDIVKAAVRNEALFGDSVQTVMTRDVIIARPSDDLKAVSRTMTVNRFRHLPVMEHGEPVGIISIGDVVKAHRRIRGRNRNVAHARREGLGPMTPGTESQPLRVAIFGSGPAAFYAAEHLFKQKQFVIEVDMFDKLPTPFGLVRYGVAPDHLKIKQVTKVFDGIAAHPRFRFFGHVEFGKDVLLAELKEYYHQIFFATGAQTDRRMGIPGEDLPGSHPATEFVAWYNGHPAYRDRQWELDVDSAAVVGVGNVAVDAARLLSLSHDEPWASDAADYAVEALSRSRVKEVHLLGRRGPAQAAFSNPEIKELSELADADLLTRADETQAQRLSAASIADDRVAKAKVEILRKRSGAGADQAAPLDSALPRLAGGVVWQCGQPCRPDEAGA